MFRIIHGDVGGVGKTLFAHVLIEFLRSLGLAILVIDADTRNPNVFRVYASARDNITAIRIDLREDAGRSELLSVLSESNAVEVVLSLPSNIGWEIEMFRGLLLGGLAEMKRKMQICWLMNTSTDSVNLLRPILDKYPAPSVVAVANLFFGDLKRFAVWANSNTRRDLLSGGGHEIVLPKLYAPALAGTVGANPPVRFSDAASVLRYGDRLMLKIWLQECYKTFDMMPGGFSRDK